ncbi:transglutaminase domain-containing protein, partial [Sphaerochaeta sp. S2]|uniref:transglutaminase family protein n=1 Tax=Sphaerochaeta sp. S2 TaxID=2798868 RepID=UPI0018EA07E9
MEYILPGGTNLAAFIYDKLYGEFYTHLILWIRNFLMGEPQFYYDLYYKIFIIYIISAIMIVVLRLLEKRIDWKFFLFAGLYFIIAWFIYVSSIRGYFAIYFIGLTVYKQFHIYENLVENAKDLGEGTRYYNYTSAIMVGAIIMVSVLFVTNIIFIFLPIESLNNKVHQVVPSISSIRSDFKTIPSSRVFNFSSTMYSPNDYLGGPILERDYSVIMRVKSNEGSLYLRGRAKNVYDGTSWTSDFETYRNNINNNPESVIPSEHLEEITLYPETLKTRTIFSPYKYYSSSFMKKQIFGNEDDIVYRKSRTNISLERYSVQYIKPEFVHLYDPFDESLVENYLQLPEEGLTNTIALTKRVTTDLEDPYEIMKTLERYLRDNYRYTLNTREVNTNLDFVEHFLFEEQKGYCTYFATSLAVMGRIAG